MLNDLLISVTNFFRDREALEALAALPRFPRIFLGRIQIDARDVSAAIWKTMSAPDSSEPSYSLRIFVVENHADSLKWLVRYLEALGHATASATTMKEALELLPLAEYEVLISDIGLPDGDGWQLLQTVRLPHPIYAIAMSGFGMNTDRVKSREAGYRHHFLKPFNPVELEGALDEAAREVTAAR